MGEIMLSLLFGIKGIGAASGLVCKGDSLYFISDSSSWLFEYDRKTGGLAKTILATTDIPENIPKKLKPDFEAITAYGDMLYIFGSGSTENRNKMVVFDTVSQKVVSENDISNLYQKMQQTSGITALGFNIEGVIYTAKCWYFFQRGNGLTGKNGIFTVTGNIPGSDFSITYKEYLLPEIKGIAATFTDAVLVGNTIYFLAAAENSLSVYDDGEVLGSLIGSIDIHDMAIGFTEKITDTRKFEGITLLEDGAKEIIFLLCEDNDTEILESDIYKLTLFKK